jgi:RNA polymerase primary sigma factor
VPCNGRNRDQIARRRNGSSRCGKGQEPVDRYLGELQGLPLLDASEERALAREIERLVIAHWSVLLSYAPARAAVLSAVEAAPEVRACIAPLCRVRVPVKASDVARVARKLRPLDRDCEALTVASAAVQDAFAQSAGAARYLERLARARDAQLQAKARFVTSNLRLVIAIARRYDVSLMPLSDLIQEGNLGLMRAVERFDYRRGFRFSTYAAWWIRHALNRGLSDKARTVRVPVHALDDVARIKRAIAASQKATGCLPSDEDLAAATGMAAEKLSLLRAYAGTPEPVSLDKTFGEDRERTLYDVLPANDASDPDQDIDLDRWRSELSELLKGLSSIEATTLRLRFGLDGADEISLREIGAKYNLSRERIRQIQVEALGKLRDALRRKQRQRDASLAA